MADWKHQDPYPDRKITYCDHVGTTINPQEGGEQVVVHHCRYPADHPATTPHSCWLCNTTWHDEATC